MRKSLVSNHLLAGTNFSVFFSYDEMVLLCLNIIEAGVWGSKDFMKAFYGVPWLEAWHFKKRGTDAVP